MNYIAKIRQMLVEEIAARGGGDTSGYEGLVDMYVLLVLTTGTRTTLEHVHDAWSAFTNPTRPDHQSLVEFDRLTLEIQEYDRRYRDAIVAVSELIAESRAAVARELERRSTHDAIAYGPIAY